MITATQTVQDINITATQSGVSIQLVPTINTVTEVLTEIDCGTA